MAIAIDEQRYMRRALQLAERGRGDTRPNPIVGAVVVRGGRVVGEGWHRRAGEAHAEVVALERAGARARGATLFVTLEPCAHTGRTPPCVDAILRAGVRRCIVALRDPHAIVNGRGLSRLRRAGVDVRLGLLADEARDALAGYWTTHTLGRPRVTWKIAASLDGRIADRRGQSRWITGPEARRRVHSMRRRADAIVIGAGTARADDPRLTVRGVARRGPAPLRVVCDSRLELPESLRLFRPPLARGTIVACRRDVPEAHAAALARRGIEVWRMPAAGDGVSPRAVARRLAQQGCHEVLLESGPRVGTAWLRAGLVDRLALFLAPRLLGAGGRAWCGPLVPGTLAKSPRGRIVEWAREGEDAFLMIDLER